MSEHVNTYHKTPRRGEVFEYIAKPTGKPEQEDDHLSQPSTLHSLSQLDSTPEKTPVSAELQKEWSNISGGLKQKASEFKGKMTEQFGSQPQPEKDLDSGVKENIKEINEDIKQQPHGEEEVVEGQGQAQPGMKERSAEKLGGLKDKLKEGSKGLMNEASRKFEQAKGKLIEKVGEQPQPEKDLDSDVKEHVKEINQEIKQQPHGEEEVVEGQGQAGSGKQDFKEKSREFTDKAADKFGEMKGQGPESQDFKEMSQGIVDKALGKIDEMKDKAGQQGEKLKVGAKEASGQISEKVQQGKSEFSSEQKVEVQEGNQPLTKDNKEEILELAQQITEKIQELKTAGQLPAESEQKFKSTETQQQSQTQSQSQGQSSSGEGHEHHQLSPESESFKPTQESHMLMEKVKEGLKEDVPLTEVVEEVDHEKQPGSGDRQPIADKLQQGAQKLSDKFSGKAEELKSKFSGPEQGERRSGSEEQGQSFERPSGLETLESQGSGFGQGERQPVLEKVQQGVQNLKEKFTAPKQEERPQEGQSERPQFEQREQKIEERPQEQEKSFRSERPREEKSETQQEQPKESFEFKPETQEKEGDFKAQPEEKESSKDSIKQNIQEASNKISDKVQDVKDKIGERREKGSEDQGEEQGEAKQENPKERQPLVDQILGRIHAVNDNFHQKVDNVKDAFKIEERTDERQPLIDIVSGKIHNVTDTISHGVEAVRSRVKPSHKEEEPEIPKREERVPEESTEKSKPSLKEKISGGYQNMSNLISENVENMKEKYLSHKEAEQAKKFHKVDENEGFPKETVKDYQDEKRLAELGGHELISENPYEPLYENREQPQGYFEKIKGRFIKPKGEDEEDESEKIKDLDEIAEERARQEAQSLKGRLNQGLESLKGRFRHEKEKTEDQAGESELLEKGKQSLKEKSAEPLKKAVGKNIEDLQKSGKLEKETSEKLEESKPMEKAEPLEKIKKDISEDINALKGQVGFVKQMEELKKDQPTQPSEVSPQESQTLKQKISGGLHDLSGKISQNVDSLKGKFRSGKEEPQGKEVEEVEALDQPEESLPQEESQPSEAEKPTLKQRLAGGFEGLKSKFIPGKGKSEEQEGQPKEGEFHVVTEGTTETIGELKEEERVEPLLSNNPFEPLETKDTNITQPLEGADVVGGDLKDLTADEKPAFKVEESSGNEENLEEGGNKSLFQKMKAGLMSTFSKSKDKENVE